MASIKVIIAVDDVNGIMESYDQIQVHRSVSGVGGPYVDITAESPTAGTISGANDASFTLNGLTLEVRIDDGATQSVTIEETDPVFIDPLVEELSEKLTDVVVDNGGTGNLRLTSLNSGTASSIEIVGGTALTELGLTVGKTTGKDRRLTLQEDYTEFTFIDSGGDTSYFYEVVFYSTLTGQTSDFSDPIPGAQVSPISASLITATIDLVGMNGEPMGGVLVIVKNVYDPNALVVSAHGVLGQSVEFSMDASGHGEIDLVMGTVVDVTITGTGVTRRISVPTSGTEFDLMSSVAVADDIFQIQTPDIPNAIRRS
jgi:hypothetical protein